MRVFRHMIPPLLVSLIACSSARKEEVGAIPSGAGDRREITGGGPESASPGEGAGAPVPPGEGAGPGGVAGGESGGGPPPEGEGGGGPPPVGEVVQAWIVLPALPPTGLLWAWGDNSRGQLCDGTTESKSTPVRVLTGVLSADGGDDHTVILKMDGTVWTCGHNQFGELGYETERDDQRIMKSQLTPRQVPGLDHVIAVAAGGRFSMALKEDGSVWTWGNNAGGKLGMEGQTFRWEPAPVGGLSHVTAITASTNFALALREIHDPDGTTKRTLWGWGWNEAGQLGFGPNPDPSRLYRSTPAQVLIRANRPLDGINAVAAGGSHTVAAVDTGVLTWGENRSGQLCDRSEGRRYYAGSGPGWETSAAVVAAGSAHTLGVDAWSNVWSCGDNSFGQLGVGHGSLVGRESPFRVKTPDGRSELRSIRGEVAAGEAHSLLLILGIDDRFGEFHSLGRGAVLAWGRNAAGQLGNGTTTDQSLPVLVWNLPSDVSAVAAGARHSLAISAPPP